MSNGIDWFRTALLIAALVVGFGAFCGATGKLVVFRDRSDLLRTFAIIGGCGLATSLVLIFAADSSPAESRIALIGVLALWLFAFFDIFQRTGQDNAGIVRTCLAVLTKIPFALLVPMLAISAIAPTGKTAAQRASSRAFAIFMLVILAPLLLALVRDKESLGKFSPTRILN